MMTIGYPYQALEVHWESFKSAESITSVPPLIDTQSSNARNGGADTPEVEPGNQASINRASTRKSEQP
jgi:hypothetical protein